MNLKPIVIFFALGLAVLFGMAEADLRQTQGGKCPYSVIDFGSISTPGDSSGYSFEVIKDTTNKASFNLWPNESALDKVSIVSPDAVGNGDCPDSGSEPVTCNPSAPYRNFDGTCNNLDHPSWVMAGECQLRLLPAAYEGSSGYRASVVGRKPLPQPRDLSNRIMAGDDRPDPELTAMSVFVGQFVTHDTMFTPTKTTNVKSCCPYDAANQARPECEPIPVRPDDPYYTRFNTTCMHFERSIACTTCGDTSGKMQKLNKVTAVLDLSMMYGMNEDRVNEMRTKDGTGELLSDWSDGQGELLTRSQNFSIFCPPSMSGKCFVAGDPRLDMHVILTSLHTVFHREHNRLAGELKQLNPEWEEETLFQETRKIMIGVWQHIVYNEYLPPLLGPRHMSHFDLWVDHSTHYDSSLRPGIFIEVSTAGFRLHSQVSRLTGLSGVRFFETQMRPDLVRRGCVDGILQGACGVKTQVFDRNFEEDIDGQFLRLPGMPYGLDSNTIDIQRGRDNGMPPYGQTVKYLTGGQTGIRSFDDLSIFMTPQNIKLLQENYESVQDVDLWVGLQLERNAPGSKIGFNSATLTALQFHRLKYGDRFFFERRGKGAPFTRAQIASLRKSSFARILCDNTNLKAIQKYPMLMPSHENPVMNCDQIEKMDLTPWKTNSGRQKKAVHKRKH